MTSEKIIKLGEEFAFLLPFLSFWERLTLDMVDKRKDISVDIKVQRSDVNLLYFTGRTTCSGSYYCKHDQYGLHHTHVYFMGNDHKPIWHQKFRGERSSLLRDAIERIKMNSQIPLTHVITVEHTTWYKRPTDGKKRSCFRHKNRLNQEYTITIHKEPKQGFASLLTDVNNIDHLNINNKLIMQLAFSNDKRDKNTLTLIDTRQKFMVDAFKPLFEKNMQYSLYHGPRSFTGKVGELPLSFATMTMAGRVMVTLTDTDTGDQVTFKGEDVESGDSHIGVGSIDATLSKAELMTKQFVDYFTPLFEIHTFNEIMSPGAVIFAGIVIGSEEVEEKII